MSAYKGFVDVGVFTLVSFNVFSVDKRYVNERNEYAYKSKLNCYDNKYHMRKL